MKNDRYSYLGQNEAYTFLHIISMFFIKFLISLVYCTILSNKNYFINELFWCFVETILVWLNATPMNNPTFIFILVWIWLDNTCIWRRVKRFLLYCLSTELTRTSLIRVRMTFRRLSFSCSFKCKQSQPFKLKRGRFSLIKQKNLARWNSLLWHM